MKIKNVFIGIALAVGSIISFFLFNKNKKEAIKKVDADIKATEEKIEAVLEEQKKVEKKRRNKKKKIAKVKTEIVALEEAKATLVVEERTAAEVKDNILNKTRRGRKPNKA